jgi:DNA-binding MarR family transcriptional regulator
VENAEQVSAFQRGSEPQSGPVQDKSVSAGLSNEFLSSARVFAWSVREILEKAVLEQVAGEKLTFAELKVLYLVEHTDERTSIGDVAEFMGVSNSGASQAVEKLVRRRLLKREETQADRRSTQLSLTEAGRKLLSAYEAARHEKAVEAFAQFSEQELLWAAELLDRLAAAIVDPANDQDHLCMQCEIYYRDKCRFGELGRRNCFYQRRKSEKEDPRGAAQRGVVYGKEGG